MKLFKIFAITVTLASSVHLFGQDVSVTAYVDPFIGTTNYGTTNPGALCPNGMMSVTPFNVMGSELNRYDKDSRW